MQKINGTAAPSPDTMVEIVLDKPRKLHFGLSAIQAFRNYHQKVIFRVIDKELVVVDEDGQTYVDPHWLAALVHVGLLATDPKMTLARTAELVHERCISSGSYMTGAIAIAEVVFAGFIKANLINETSPGRLLASVPSIVSWLLARDRQQPETIAYVTGLVERAVVGDAAGAIEATLRHAGASEALVESIAAMVAAEIQVQPQAPASDPTPADVATEALDGPTPTAAD